MRDVCVGRQPIFDSQRNIAGWELLFRSASGRGPGAAKVDGNRATASALLTALVEIGLERVAGAEPVFINCTREFLERAPLLPPERCVLEVLENIEQDRSLLDSLDRLRAAQYSIALDDFVYTAERAPLVERADIVKLDVLALGMTETANQVGALRPFGVKLLAEKIDSGEKLEACIRLGFDLFQGYYLRRPETMRARAVKVGQPSAMTLAGECRNENADLAKITRIISADATLSFKMLQLANSALFSSRPPIQSIPHAVSVVGLDALVRWSILLVLAGIDHCPPSYLQRAVERGRMCELLARLTRVNEDSAYLTGLLSILESALEAPIAELTPQLPVSGDIKDALIDHSGELGQLLHAVISYESVDEASNPNFPLPVLERCFWEAAAYAKAATARLGLEEYRH
jgi:c-di-GMP phosphodiesterase